MIAAHLIVGRHAEPFLPALLASLEGVADVLLVNDNSGAPDGPNARNLRDSAFALAGRMFVDDAPFVDFAAARNRVLDLHRAHAGDGWIAFVDADEVHHPAARTIARNLERLPSAVATVDGYTRHFVQSFGWYASIERRTAFYRFTPELHWEGVVHERLAGIRGTHLAIPYVYEHYGWVLPVRRIAAKGRQYSALGQPGATWDDDAIDTDALLGAFWPRALRFHGTHPPAVAATRAALEREHARAFADTDDTVRRFQSPRVRLANVGRRLNFEFRWRARALDGQARRLLSSA